VTAGTVRLFEHGRRLDQALPSVAFRADYQHHVRPGHPIVPTGSPCQDNTAGQAAPGLAAEPPA